MYDRRIIPPLVKLDHSFVMKGKLMEESLKVGTLLKNTYEIMKTLYKGELYNFYLVIDRRNPAILLQLTEILIARIPGRKALLTEEGFIEAIDLLKHISHPMLPVILDGFHHGVNACLVLSYCEGISLESLIQMNISPLSAAETIERAKSLISILKFFYDRPTPIPFVHIDPQHICVSEKGEMLLMGFGLHLFLDHYHSSTDALAFCAPEISESTAFSESASVYTIAALMYYLCTKRKWDGRRHDNPRPREIEKNIPENFQDVLLTAISRNPEYRYLNLEILQKKLDEVVNPPAARQVEEKGPPEEAAFVKESRILQKSLHICGIAIGSLLITALLFIFFSGPLFDKKSTTDSLFAYILIGEKKSISQIDLLQGISKRIISIPGTGRAMAVAPDGRRLYLTREERTLSIIDTVRGALAETYPLKGSPDKILLSKDGSLAYISNTRDEFMTQWDTRSHESQELPPTGPQISAAISPDGAFVYAIGSEREEVSVVDTKKKQFITAYPAGPRPGMCVVDRTGRYLIVTSLGPAVNFFDTQYHNLAKAVPVERGIKYVVAARSQDKSNYVYVACEEGKMIYAIDLGTFAVMKKKESLGIPRAIDVSPDGKKLYLLTASPNSLVILNARTLDRIKDIPCGLMTPQSLAVWP
jgi:DNA-binding beta-propeller fold protein YncE